MASVAPADDSDPGENAEGAVLGKEGDPDEVAETSTTPRPVPGSAGLIAEANRVLQTMTASSYSHKTHVAGTVYAVDCSGFVDLLLARVEPAALAEVCAATVKRPLAKHFVQFLSSDTAKRNFHRLTRIQQLAPGDIIAWDKPEDVTSTNTGHVMIVSAPPAQHQESLWAVPIIDSSAAPHGNSDARKRAHTTGIGQGVVLLEADPTGAPIAYHWTLAQGSLRHVTKIALGRVL
jgi:hypothetical protein